jgi:RND family efflux transporter MFP subunit
VRRFAAVLVLATLPLAMPAAAQDALPDLSGVDAALSSEVEVTRQIRAQITPRRSTSISAPMTGRIVEIDLRDGDRFETGRVLVRFDCALPDAQLARARAGLEKRQSVHEVNKRLNKLGSVSTLELQVNAAEVAEATAEQRLARTMVERCVVAAPFAGRVGEVAARQYQFIGEGQPMLEILDDGDLELEMIVPSRWIAWLRTGHRFDVAVEETGRTYPAEVARLSSRVDPVSQSIKVYGRIVGDTSDLLAGMSGSATILPPERP